MPRKTHGLGRGLDALLPEAELTAGGQEIDIGELDPNPDQPRRTFSPESIAQLAASIREQGVLQPILVTPTPGGRYRIVAGERRYRAAREAGLERVPCVVRELDADRQMEIALIENLQREDLNPMDAAQGIQALMAQCGYTQEKAAERLGKSRPAVANLLRLLTLPEDVAALVRGGSLSAGHARVLAGLKDADRQRAFAQRAVREGLSVRELETLAAGEPEKKKTPARRAALTPELRDFQARLRDAVGMKVTVAGGEKRGRVTLHYASADELQRLWELCERLGEMSE